MTTTHVVLGSFAEDPDAPPRCPKCNQTYDRDLSSCPLCAESKAKNALAEQEKWLAQEDAKAEKEAKRKTMADLKAEKEEEEAFTASTQKYMADPAHADDALRKGMDKRKVATRKPVYRGFDLTDAEVDAFREANPPGTVLSPTPEGTERGFSSFGEDFDEVAMWRGVEPRSDSLVMELLGASGVYTENPATPGAGEWLIPGDVRVVGYRSEGSVDFVIVEPADGPESKAIDGDEDWSVEDAIIDNSDELAGWSVEQAIIDPESKTSCCAECEAKRAVVEEWLAEPIDVGSKLALFELWVDEVEAKHGNRTDPGYFRLHPNAKPNGATAKPSSSKPKPTASKPGGKPSAPGETKPGGKKPKGDGVTAPIKVRSVAEAVRELEAGRKIELRQPRQVSTLLKRLEAIAKDAKAKGEKAPLYDLCNVSVKGTNLFCEQSKKVPRSQMPQLSGVPLAGSKASKLETNKRGEVDLSAHFRQHLLDKGVKIERTTEKASYLKASQNELNGTKVAGITAALESGVVMDGRLFTSWDNYIIDGHHRWAATVGLDLADNKEADLDMNIDRIDMDVLSLLAEANAFAADWGIPQAGVAAEMPDPMSGSTSKPEAKHGNKGEPGYELLHPDTAMVARIVADKPRQPGEDLFAWQSRVVQGLPPVTQHELLLAIKERYEPAPPCAREAREWREAKGLPEPKVDWASVKADRDKAAKVALAYAKLRNRPDDPRVKAAYDDFKRQNEEMWQVLVTPEDRGGMGLSVEFVDDPEPYESAAAQADDVRNNRRIRVANDLGAGHPMMSTDEYNRFRAVHDVFGHVAIGSGFDRHGEYAAWLAHNSMYTEPGRRAMSTEYHGSNSALWNGVPTRAVADLLPDELTESTFDEEGNWVRKSADPVAGLIAELGLDAAFANRFDNAYDATGSNHIAAMSLSTSGQAGAFVKALTEAKHGSPDRVGYHLLHPRGNIRGVSTDQRGRGVGVPKRNPDGSYPKMNAEQLAARKAEVERTMVSLLDRGATTIEAHFDKDKGGWSAERRAYHDKILDEMMTRYESIPRERRALFLGGLGGAGKTTSYTDVDRRGRKTVSVTGRAMGIELDPGGEVSSHATVNPDDFKEMLARDGMVPNPAGISPMESATLVHAESSYLAKRLTEKLVAQGTNLLYDGSFGKHDKTEAMLAALKRAELPDGTPAPYTTTVAFVSVRMETSLERVAARWARGQDLYNNGYGQGGRLFPSSIIRAQADKTGRFRSHNEAVYDQLRRRRDLVDVALPVFDNEVPEGTPPIPIPFGAHPPL